MERTDSALGWDRILHESDEMAYQHFQPWKNCDPAKVGLGPPRHRLSFLSWRRAGLLALGLAMFGSGLALLVAFCSTAQADFYDVPRGFFEQRSDALGQMDRGAWIVRGPDHE